MTEDDQKGNEDKDLDDFAEEVKNGKDIVNTETSKKRDVKTIVIDWAQVPYIFSLKEKMKKALELDLEHIPGEEAFLVKNGAGPHTVTENSCDCKDWEVNGTSISPCKHILRAKYSKDELTKMLDKVSPETIINGKAKKMQKSKKGVVVQKAEERETALVESDEEELLIIPDLTPALAEIGKIKIGFLGEKRTKGGRRLPEKLDHFELGTLMKNEEGGVIMDEKMTEAISGDKTELDISLCYDEPALNFPTFYAAFTQSKLACMGDGRKAWQWQEDGERKEIVCNRRQCPLSKDNKCKPYGRLSVILTTANRIGGTYVFRTTSWNSLRNLLSSMSFIRNQTGGILAGIPLKLKLRAATALPNGLGRRVKIYIVNIEYAGTMVQLKQDATAEIKRRRLLGLNMNELEQVQKGAIREHAREEAEEEAEEISGEFYVEGEGE